MRGCCTRTSCLSPWTYGVLSFSIQYPMAPSSLCIVTMAFYAVSIVKELQLLLRLSPSSCLAWLMTCYSSVFFFGPSKLC